MKTLIPPKTDRFNVTVYYKEPFFSETIEKSPDTIFSSSFHVVAENPEEAKKMAIDDFFEIAKESSVNWERKIVNVKVEKESA
jgi:hypothetical protein